MLTAMTRINISSIPPVCFKMKSDKEPNPATDRLADVDDHLDVSLILERLGLADIDDDDVSESEWCFPETPFTEMASRHLSGGGLVTKTSDLSTSRTITPALSVSSLSSDDCSSNPSNPFKNANMRLVLEADEVMHELEEEIDMNFDLSSRNPFRNTTKCLLPTEDRSCTRETVNQATQTVRETKEYMDECRRGLDACGWYHGRLSWQDSIALLQDTEPGTFFVRDSADPNFLFSLSLQTIRGPTSVRLHHFNGRFRLDSETNLFNSIPSFPTVIDLVEHYLAKSRRKSKKTKPTKDQVWVDVHGQIYSNIMLTKPLLRQGDVLPLKHLCRLQVNTLLKCNLPKCDKHITNSRKSKNSHTKIFFMMDKLSVPPSVGRFLKEYPYSM